MSTKFVLLFLTCCSTTCRENMVSVRRNIRRLNQKKKENNMAEVRGCNIPEDRFYWVEKHAWARLEEDGFVTIGITDVAQHMAKGIINATPKDVGRTVQKGKSAGTLESGKWVGPVTSPIT